MLPKHCDNMHCMACTVRQVGHLYNGQTGSAAVSLLLLLLLLLLQEPEVPACVSGGCCNTTAGQVLPAGTVCR
jgi:hypothetical protein